MNPPSQDGALSRMLGASLRYKEIVIALTVLLALFGLYSSWSQARYDVFPEFAPPQVTIQTEAGGLAPEQVEALVTQPIENAVNGVSGVVGMRSQSIQGLSVVIVTFEPRSDIYRDRQNLAERLSAVAAQLPTGVQAPAMSPLTSSVSTVLVVGLTSETKNLMALRTLADWTLKPRLLAVPGVANVSVFGGEARELQIQVRRQSLVKYDLSLADVLEAARRATGVRGAGVIDSPNQRIVIQSYGQSLTAAELSRAVVRHESGTNITLADLADVQDAPEPSVGGAQINGHAGIQLMISEQHGADTMTLTLALEKVLDALRPSLVAEQVILHGDLFRPANFIEVATRNVQQSLALGGLLVILVVAVFLFNWRTSLIALLAIPLSLLTAVTVMAQQNISLNTMTLGGLAIAVGLLVDDAIIVVENVYRRLRENRTLKDPIAAINVVLDASLEVRSAVVYATLAIALVFVPVLTLPGLAGRLFSPLATAYLLATMASLLVAVTVTPALCLALLPGSALPEHDPAVARELKTRYRSVLVQVERRFGWIVALVSILTLAALAALPFLGGGFIPELKEGHYIAHVSATPGTSIGESLRIGRQIANELAKLPFVRSVGQRVGRAEKADDTWGTHYSEFDIDLKPSVTGEDAEVAQADIRRALARIPGVNSSVKTFLTERVEETLSGYTSSVVVNLFGHDLDVLDSQAKHIAKRLGEVPGASEVQIQSPSGTPQIGVRLRPQELSRWGLSAVEVLEAVQTAFQGTVVGQVYDGNQVFNVNVILAPTERRSIADVQALMVRNASGVHLRLEQLADVFSTSGRYAVLHTGARRVQTIICNVVGRDVVSFVNEAQKHLASEAHLPAGYYLEFGGSAQAQSASLHDLLAHSAMAAAAIGLLLWVVLKKPRNVGLVLLNLPFALAGGVIAVFATGGGVTLGALVGFVTLFGITLRNSVMLLSHYEHLVSVEGATWSCETAARGAIERVSPILMTVLATALGLLPLAISSGGPGYEIEGPMAIVILGGLLTSTALNLLVLPGLAWRFGRF